MVNSDRDSTMVLAMPSRTCGRLEVTFSPSGRITASCENTWLVLAVSAAMFPRANAGSCGSTIHEAWAAATAPPNAAGFRTAGP